MTKRVIMGALLAATASQAADISSLIFYDYTHEATEGGANDGSFGLGRAYLTATGSPSESVSFKLQFDVGQLKSYTLKTGTTTVTDSDGDTVAMSTYSLSGSDAGFYAFVKNACVDWTNPLGKWTFGMQGMNMFNVQENTFGNRFLDKPLMDTRGWSSSADMGVGYAREFGLVKTSLLYTNGGGYKKAESDKYKKISLQLVAGETALNKKDGWNAGLVYSMEPFKSSGEVEDRNVLGLFGGWAGMGARLGAEFDTKTTTGATDVTEQIMGVYGDYKLPFAPGWDVYASMDMFDPNTDSDDDGSTTMIVGAKVAPVKGLVIAPNLKTTSYEDSDFDSDTWYRVNFEFKI